MPPPARDEAGANARLPDQPQRLHPDVLKLGLVSFLTDLSSEMIFRCSPSSSPQWPGLPARCWG